MLTFVVVVGLGGALIFGAADFLGGLASKRISSIRVTATAAVTGLIVLLLTLPLTGGEWSTEVILYGGLSGISGAGAIVLLYACLGIGPMSILSPLTTVVSAIVPMTAGLIRGERLEPLGYLAVGLALVVARRRAVGTSRGLSSSRSERIDAHRRATPPPNLPP